MISHSTEILIVGAGPAGLAAAAAALTSGRKVTILDQNAAAGGQIWRAEPDKNGSDGLLQFGEALSSPNLEMFRLATVFDIAGARSLAVETPAGRLEIEYIKVVLATGARERFIPFPGWTLPGVFGAGGLQALVKGGLDIGDKRVVIAGTGPLLLAVGDYLKSKGARVLLIAEQTSAAKIRRFARGLWRSPDKMVQAAALRARLVGIPYHTDSWVISVSSPTVTEGKVFAPLHVTITRRGSSRTVDCDYLACGFHLVPNTELPALLSCQIKNGFVETNEFQCTSLANIYCAGEPTGIGGVESSLIEGRIAGLAAAGFENEARRLFAQRERTRRFTYALDKTFALRSELKDLANDETIVCRCEDVRFGELKTYTNAREAKLQTRCAMGACQGRVCGPVNEFVFGWERGRVRPPIFPVKMENL